MEDFSENLEGFMKWMDGLTKEDIDRMIEEMQTSECDPDTCQGQCQGTGGCDVCLEFRGE